jgi:hypothetical protein
MPPELAAGRYFFKRKKKDVMVQASCYSFHSRVQGLLLLIKYISFRSDMERKQGYTVYDSLDPLKREIRLLEILPPRKGIASCRHIITSLTETSLPYVALSYTWGNPYNPRDKRPFQEAHKRGIVFLNGTLRYVPHNLATALRHLEKHVSRYYRSRSTPKEPVPDGKFLNDRGPSSMPLLVWADDLCIDQENDVERGHQV